MKTEAGEYFPYKMVVYKATPQSNINLDFSNNGDPGEMEIKFDILATADNDMLDLIMIEDEDGDTAIAE